LVTSQRWTAAVTVALATGTRLGPYEVTGKLGEGGMGEVWRATDSRLKREVALKVLPAAFAADADRLARFEREAQLLAQLHHPHIASIFGLEDAGGAPALVMELVEGPTLAERLQRGPLPLDEVLAIARQVAEALEAAHAKGIVHRDLKPANVKLHADGTVKVLDFGLAKAMDAAASGSSASAGASPAIANSPTLMHSPTLAGPAGTQLGVILGTAAYMAPEQARGGAVDRRADIWAFGVVLFEMLTGKPLFSGESVVDTLSSVMRQEVDLESLPRATPRALRELLRRCLQRNPKQRLHDIADARIVLEELATGAGDEEAASAVAGGWMRANRGRTIVLAVTIGVAALLAGSGLDRLLGRPAADPWSSARWALAVPDGLELSTRSAPQLALSADGRLQVAVVLDGEGRSQLLLRSSEEIEPRLLPDTVGAQAPFFSPDDAWIAFFRDRALYKLPTRGGPPVLLAETSRADATRGGAWSRDGFVYFAGNVNAGLSRVAATGGPISPVTSLDEGRDERTHRWPAVLPDGSAVLFTCDTFGSIEYYDDARIEAVRPATGERKVLVEGSSMARYADGQLVFARDGSLFAVGLDPRTLAVQGTPRAVVAGVATEVSSGAAQFALSASGAALWAPGGLSAQYQVVFIEPTGAETPAPVGHAPYNEVALSPDGTRAALVGGPEGEGDLWVADAMRGATTRLTRGAPVFNPTWSPDGKSIAYVARVRGPGKGRHWLLGLIPADGSRASRALYEDENAVTIGSFTADGSGLVVSRTPPASRMPGAETPTSASTLFTLSLAHPGTLQPLAAFTGERAGEAAVSPDGRWVAYTTTEGEAPNVYLRPFPSGEGRWQISAPMGLEPHWTPDGKAIYYRGANVLYRVRVGLGHEVAVGKPEAVLDRVSNAGSVHGYSIGANGRLLLLRAPPGGGTRRTLDLDLGFATRLARGEGTP
jgi:Tol biopolymer transport system component